MKLKPSSGQVLVEIIIASLVIITISVGIAQVLTTSIRGVKSSATQTAASFLARETSDAARAISKEDWHNVSDMATSSSNKYYPAISGGKWAATAGTENIALNGIVYTRSFYLDDVYRSTSTKEITSSGGYLDPSTMKVSIAVIWTEQDGSGQTFTQSFYVSRFMNQVYPQTDWSGGATGEQTTTGATTNFATSSNINYSSTTGSIELTQ